MAPLYVLIVERYIGCQIWQTWALLEITNTVHRWWCPKGYRFKEIFPSCTPTLNVNSFRKVVDCSVFQVVLILFEVAVSFRETNHTLLMSLQQMACLNSFRVSSARRWESMMKVMTVLYKLVHRPGASLQEEIGRGHGEGDNLLNKC